MKNLSELADKLKEEINKLNKKQATVWAIECAERVIHHFERSNPKDSRPREALQIARRWLSEEVVFKEIRKSALDAHAAARGAEDLAAIYVARSCAHAVATAHVITHAVGAALYALKAVEQLDPNLVEEELFWQLRRLEKIKIGASELYES